LTFEIKLESLAECYNGFLHPAEMISESVFTFLTQWWCQKVLLH